jgi:23S rRNA pseudouridine1911/1915/1917 synthase
VVGAGEAGARLDDVLASWLPGALGRPFSRSLVRRLVMAGAVRVDGQPSRRPADTLAAGTVLDVRIDVSRLPPPTPTSFRVVHRDASLIVVDKPSGLPTVPTADPSRPSLVALLKGQLPAGGHLGVHQRLDAETSGLVLFSLDPAADAALAEQFEGREVRKTYLALVPAGPAREAWTAAGPLGGDGPQAVTEFRVVERRADCLLVEARPRTGRKHQIRIHLAEAGLPILGDRRYGGEARVARVMLHAWRLQLRHPATGSVLRLESPRPEDFTALLRPARTTPTSPAPGRGRPRPRGEAGRVRGRPRGPRSRPRGERGPRRG